MKKIVLAYNATQPIITGSFIIKKKCETGCELIHQMLQAVRKRSMIVNTFNIYREESPGVLKLQFTIKHL